MKNKLLKLLMVCLSLSLISINISYASEIHFCHGDEKSLLNKNNIKYAWFINEAALLRLNLNCTNEQNGDTPLMIASKNNFLESVRALVDDGADVNQQNVNGHTAVYYAEMMKHTIISQYLYQHGANLQMKKTNGTHFNT